MQDKDYPELSMPPAQEVFRPVYKRLKARELQEWLEHPATVSLVGYLRREIYRLRVEEASFNEPSAEKVIRDLYISQGYRNTLETMKTMAVILTAPDGQAPGEEEEEEI